MHLHQVQPMADYIFLKQDCATEIIENNTNNQINKDGSKITHYALN